ncbi:hypothetical protein D9615_002368 [Tricholomella constricta]|uniref:F-box domain-containing protein n=1 Tax=Tricholomella constricta TaxID=117010 RepID=A0A8H5HMQ1_9AGAR|nr:hypothetical protein D9615_002368 [Tricholomella constricta]
MVELDTLPIDTAYSCPVPATADGEEHRLAEQLDALMNERARILRALAGLESSIQLVNRQLGRIRNDKSVTARLPPELLGKVFEHVYRNWKPKRRKRPVEMILSQVSRHWRCVALGVSTLWTNIHVSKSRPTGSLQSYLERSKKRPLQVNFDLRASDGYGLHLVWPRVVEHVSRWCRVSIKANTMPGVIQALRLLEHHSAPLLQELRLLCDDDDEFNPSPDVQYCGILRGGTPRLKTLAFDGSCQPTHLPPLSNVVTLFIQNSEATWEFYRDLRPLLAGLTSLTSLSISQDIALTSEESPNEHLVIPTLRTLRLRYHHFDDLYEPFWQGISAPSLEALHLVGACDGDIELLFETLEAREAYPSQVKSLVIDLCDFETLTAFQLLATMFPRVEHLTCIPPTLGPINDFQRIVRFWNDVATFYVAKDSLCAGDVHPDVIRQRLGQGAPGNNPQPKAGKS